MLDQWSYVGGDFCGIRDGRQQASVERCPLIVDPCVGIAGRGDNGIVPPSEGIADPPADKFEALELLAWLAGDLQVEVERVWELALELLRAEPLYKARPPEVILDGIGTL